MQNNQTRGLRTFFVIWAAQIVSVLGSQLSGFALGVWVYDTTRSVTYSALAYWAFNVPQVLLSPLAGVLVDRLGRRRSMILSDLGAGLAVLTAALLYFAGALRPWMIVPINLVLSAFNSLMWPAQSASITVLVPKEQYGRANGLLQTIEAFSQLAGPALAGSLYVLLQVGYLGLIDFGTYLFAIAVMLLFVRIPEPSLESRAASPRSSILAEMRLGWDYIVERRGLVNLLLYFALINLLGNLVFPLFTPYILDNWSAAVLGYLGTTLGAGMLAGTLFMSAWGGTKRKIHTLLGAGVASGIFLALAGIRASIPLLAVSGASMMFVGPIMNAASQAIWQSKVPPEIQGRVFSVRRGIAWSSGIVAPLLAGPLADYVFKPAMAPGHALGRLLGPIVGVGSNHGISVMFILIGLATSLVSLVAFRIRRLVRVELDLPDHGA
ncbi:MAG TPA: MFS transporter [Rectinemataceae bacterium]|nr:MFS transporter [Rectinemataceae bacterium]